ncbi:dephospho-CoA kinase [Ferruginibacter sp.]
MLKIGLTGGIGGGKSTVAKVFEVLGMPVYYADDAAKKLMNEEGPLKQQIQKIFGATAYRNGQLDRKYVADIVFKKPDKLQLLNALVHPATINDAQKWMQRQRTSYAIKEAALIFESGAQQKLDYVIGVFAPTPLRIQRTMQRDGITEEEVIARINKQLDENSKMQLCDFVIINDEKQLLIPQVVEVHKKITALTNKK